MAEVAKQQSPLANTGGSEGSHDRQGAVAGGSAVTNVESLPWPSTARMAWYAIRVKSKCEMQTHRELCLRGFTSFLPLYRARRRWSDRVKILDLPLFPGYLFGRFELDNRVRVLNLPGVVQIVGAGSRPIPVPDSEMESIQTLVNSRIALVPWPYLRTGQRVVIDHGPLAGVEGIVLRAADGRPRVVVSVSLLQRSVSAEIERDWISAIR